jgi:hypothetical protein
MSKQNGFSYNPQAAPFVPKSAPILPKQEEIPEGAIIQEEFDIYDGAVYFDDVEYEEEEEEEPEFFDYEDDENIQAYMAEIENSKTKFQGLTINHDFDVFDGAVMYDTQAPFIPKQKEQKNLQIQKILDQKNPTVEKIQKQILQLSINKKEVNELVNELYNICLTKKNSIHEDLIKGFELFLTQK